MKIIDRLIICVVLLLVAFVVCGCKEYRELHQSYNEESKKSNAPLSYGELYPIIVEATSRWIKLLDNNDLYGNDVRTRLLSLRFIIVEFDNPSIMATSYGPGKTILIDGYTDWFIDKTPKYDEEYKIAVTIFPGYLLARDIKDVKDKYDLLSVVMHEIGHKLGLKHSNNVLSLMYSTASRGERTLPR